MIYQYYTLLHINKNRYNLYDKTRILDHLAKDFRLKT